ncbi:PDZ domain-containing protein [Armatimonas rosea]|uniref:Peptide-binding protein n=1 Tax=Armatimonas rosea TaxID=685828 RepID=A0A7W9SWP3_ARMRO|nr:PDZ domain-containing protein [Armatimonas rosea]MBB6053604.1 hypothetical protein [Armatimonas rosea]
MAEFFVAPGGVDSNAGTKARPFATLARAQEAARKAGGGTVTLRAGTYYLPETLVLTERDSGTTWRAARGEEAVVSGGTKLDLAWEPSRGGIWKAATPAGLTLDQLFVNGERQHMARYPNFDPSVRHFNGYAADAFSKERASRWANPTGAFLHAMHRHEWGDFHYRVTGKNADGTLAYEGGWQNNRRLGMHETFRMVENVFEELDAPGEWFHDEKANLLYFYPPEGLALKTAVVEAVRLRHLVELRGTSRVALRGLTFRHAARTFMDNKEPLQRSDWTCYRGGALYLTGTESCTIEDCLLDQLGGNAIFVSGKNRRVTVRGCHIVKAGANGVAFIGEAAAVRSPLFEYGERQTLAALDRTPGPKTDDFPTDCLVEDCLIHETGRVEKQTAPVQIEIARRITVRHCSLYDVPRAGLNIGDGCFGGHVVEHCDIFNTVLETGDHGSFNSWGRDRYWGLKDVDLNTVTLGENRNLPLLDVVEPNILRNNRWRCDHGWDIDLDDGSSHYELRNNLCLHGGIKLREGFYRVCENNVMVNNSFHPHVWYGNSQDVFRRNIVFSSYKPIGMKAPWGKECDTNLWHVPGQKTPLPATELQKQNGAEAHSIQADAQFVNPTRGDYRVKPGSPALALGFVNFPMDAFGVRKPALKALAKTPELPVNGATEANTLRTAAPRTWLGARVKNIVGLGEVSAYGLPGESGVLVLAVPVTSPLARAGVKNNDVIVALGDKRIATTADLPTTLSATKVTFYRDQQRLVRELVL